MHRKFREPQRRLQINFSLFIAPFFEQHSKDSRWDDDAIVAGIMQAENLCRFMSPYGNDAHKGTNSDIVTIPRCAVFDFYAAAKKESQTHFYAKLVHIWLSGKHKNSKLGNKQHYCSIITHLSRSQQARWGKQMHLMKYHFHEFCSPIQMWKKSWARSNLRGIQFRFTTWCSWCPSHILIIWGEFSDKGQRRESVGGKSSAAKLKSSPAAIYDTRRRMHFIADHNFHPRRYFFHCFEFQSWKSDLRRRNLIQIWIWEKEPSTSSRPAWQNSSRMK